MAKDKAVRNMTKEEQLDLIDRRIDEAAELWKKYVRESDFGFGDMLSRASSRNPIISPRQQ